MQTAKQPLSQEYALSRSMSRKSGKQPQTGKQPACKHRALSPVLAAAIIFITIPAMTEVRVMDMSRVMSAYGFKGGVFDYNAPVAKKMSNECDERVLGIEGDKDLVDSSEEFLTAAYICPVKISYNAQKIVDKELPKGKEGALRLCSIWLKKVAEHRENSTQYWQAIAIVKEKAKEKYGVELSDTEISDYYAESMRKKIDETPIRLLTKDEAAKVKELLLAYLVSPSDENANNFRDFVDGISGLQPKKGGAIFAFVEKISPDLCGKIV